MANELAAISQELAAAVARAERHVAAVHARPRFSSSGVFWRPGVIVTAEHTLRRKEDVTVTLPDGNTVAATVVGSDAGSDLAVLRFEGAGDAGLTHATSVTAGQIALSIGRSQDSGVNATMGIISAVSGPWRTWRGGRLDNYIRLDLTLYPGSSGGLVVNTAGETIGIATSALSRIAGLAIPSSTVNRVVDEILSRGHVARGYLGVGLQPVELPYGARGLIVLSLEQDGPASKAGLLIGDIVTGIAGKPVGETEGVQDALAGHVVGTPIELDVLRGGEARKVAVVVAERPRG